MTVKVSVGGEVCKTYHGTTFYRRPAQTGTQLTDVLTVLWCVSKYGNFFHPDNTGWPLSRPNQVCKFPDLFPYHHYHITELVCEKPEYDHQVLAIAITISVFSDHFSIPWLARFSRWVITLTTMCSFSGWLLQRTFSPWSHGQGMVTISTMTV